MSDFLGDSIYPAKMNQARGLDQEGFSAWLDQTELPRSVKSGIRKRLQPVLSATRFEAVLLSGVKLKSSNRTTDVALVGVIPDLRQKLGTDVFVIYGEPSGGSGSGGSGNDGPDMQDVCQYNDCYCANPNNCSCTSTTRFTKNCPPNECSTAGDSCGGGSSGGGGGSILDALSAF